MRGSIRAGRRGRGRSRSGSAHHSHATHAHCVRRGGGRGGRGGHGRGVGGGPRRIKRLSGADGEERCDTDGEEGERDFECFHKGTVCFVFRRAADLTVLHHRLPRRRGNPANFVPIFNEAQAPPLIAKKRPSIPKWHVAEAAGVA